MHNMHDHATHQYDDNNIIIIIMHNDYDHNAWS